MVDFLKSVGKIALFVGVLYVIGCVVLFFGQAWFLYPEHALKAADKSSYDARLATAANIGYLPMQIDGPAGTIEGLWFDNPESRGEVLLWFHGRDEKITELNHFLAPLAKRGLHVFATEYRGYGRSEGSPSEEAFLEDAVAIHKHLVDEVKGIDRRSVYAGGFDIGAVLAMRLAAEVDVAGVIAMAPIKDFPSIIQRHLKVVPANLILRDSWDSRAAAAAMTSDLLVIHGSEDEMVSVQDAEAIVAAAGGKSKLTVIRGSGPTGILRAGRAALWEEIDYFIARGIR